MTIVDLIIGVFVLSMALVGYDRGLIRSALPLGGFLAGAVIGGRLGPALLSGGSESAYAPVITLVCALIVGAILALAMEGAAEALRPAVRPGSMAARADGVGGAVLLAALALVMAWAAGAVTLHAPGAGARDLRESIQRSKILAELNEVMPPSGPLLNILRRVDPTPAIKGPEADVAPPSSAIARDPDVDRAGDSVVKILGTACGLGVEGSGWVAAPGIVVTNAHVVAGEDDTSVTPRAGGSGLDATVVHYESRNDLAILRVPELDATPLQIAPDVAKGTDGAVLGYPENGPFTISPARIGGTGEVLSQDSYGRGPVRRLMTPFRGVVHSGNSGGPAVGASGQVLTTVFAAQQGGGPPGGLGVPNQIVRDALNGPLRPTGSGPCAA
jgi:S1-C subfamily serine protease